MRHPISIIERENTIVVRGNARMLLEAGQFKGIYAGTVRGWMLDLDRLADLTAFLDSRRVAYRVTTERGDDAA